MKSTRTAAFSLSYTLLGLIAIINSFFLNSEVQQVGAMILGVICVGIAEILSVLNKQAK